MYGVDGELEGLMFRFYKVNWVQWEYPKDRQWDFISRKYYFSILKHVQLS